MDQHKKWIVAFAPLRILPSTRSSKLLDMPVGSIVEPTGNEQFSFVSSIEVRWVEVVYLSSTKRWQGWVYEGFLEDYQEVYPSSVVSIPSPTIDPTDAAQYMIWLGQKQYNLCGELCVCYITGADIEAMLQEWEAEAVSFYRRVFGSGRARGTDLAELDSMLEIFGYAVPSVRLEAGLRDAVIGRAIVTPGRMQKLIENHRAIVGVHIDASTGNLRGSGILHWVVVESVTPNGVNGGWVEIYNPFPNRMQKVSWKEFTDSMAAPYGVLVGRSL